MNNLVKWADLARLKKDAKAADHLVGLTYMQRRDVLAKTHFGVQHFHELRKRYEAQVDGHVELVDGAHHCRFCRLTFNGAVSSDRKEHLRRHQAFEEALEVLGYLPADYTTRERLKRKGYELMHAGRNDQARMGGLAIFLSHYDRSLERAIVAGRWARHPCFVDYVPNALAAAEFLPKFVQDQLELGFGVSPGVIPKGHTDWPTEAPAPGPRDAAKIQFSKRLRETLMQALQAQDD